METSTIDRSEILEVLSQSSSKVSPQTATLRQQAHDLVSKNQPSDLTSLPTTLLDLLTQVIKVLFTSSKHPALTSTGRKNLITPSHPLGTRFNSPLIDDDLKPWKTPFTIPLLRYILTSYSRLPEDLKRPTVEAHFHLHVPPILNLIDDSSPAYKAAGCHLLRLLCALLVSVNSEMLKKTGLADVFFDALKSNFMLLPTLTPEEESLEVMQELYPAFLATVDARFAPAIDAAQNPASKEFAARQELLKLLLRHGVLASLSHLSSGQSFSNSTSIPLSTFLVAQVTPLVERMGIESVRFLREILPVLRGGLMDPFALAAPELISETLNVLVTLLDLCEIRIREKWWPEILRGLVGCWLNCFDEVDGKNGRGEVDKIERKLNKIVNRLEQVVEAKEWKDATEKLVAEEEDLSGLFKK